MSEENNSNSRIAERLIQLQIQGSSFVIKVAGGIDSAPLPIPASRIDWIAAAAIKFWHQRQRCLAAVLLVDPPSGRWTIRLPSQRCGKSGVNWSVTAADFAELGAAWLLGGTFQATSCANEVTELVPEPDGFHFILVHKDESSDLRAFIRAEGKLSPAGQYPVMINDWAIAIDAAMRRLKLA